MDSAPALPTGPQQQQDQHRISEVDLTIRKLKRCRRTSQLEAVGRPDHALERTVICFNAIVQVFRGPVLDIFDSSPPRCKHRMALGYEASLSVVIDEGG